MEMAIAVIKESIQQELEHINNLFGNLRPETVVEFAKNPETALHGRFNWEDTEAAHKWRLHQARQVLRVYVHMDLPKHEEPVRVRAFVSLPIDRASNGQGYRPIDYVLRNDDLRAQMLASAKRELKSFREKYRTLTELSEIHAAIDRVLL